MMVETKMAIELLYAFCDKNIPGTEQTTLDTLRRSAKKIKSYYLYDKNTVLEYFRYDLYRCLIYICKYEIAISENDLATLNDYLGGHHNINEIISSASDISDEEMLSTSCFPSFFALASLEGLCVAVGSEIGIRELLISVIYEISNEIIVSKGNNINQKNFLSFFLLSLRFSMKTVTESMLNQLNKTVGAEKHSDSIIDSQIEESLSEIRVENSNFSDSIQKLNALVGLSTVKHDVSSLINLIKISSIRRERGISQPPISLHMVFSGNPGTGKTVVARILSEIYHDINLLSKGHLVETDRSGLVGGFLGQTAIKTKAIIDSALGGILFIDEAYSLTTDKEQDSYGKEAVDTLLKAMEDNRNDLVVIVAGYPEEMQSFLDSNPGLRSRFSKHITFPDYNENELYDIFLNFMQQSGLVLSEDAEWAARAHLKQMCLNKSKNFANARDVRNYHEKALFRQANRLAQLENPSTEQLSEIIADDLVY